MLARYLVLRKDGEMRLFGDCFNDARFPDGHWLLTNVIVAHEGNEYITDTPTRYEVGREITMQEMCDIWRREKLYTEGVKYCIQVANIIQLHLDKEDKVLKKFLGELYALAKYDEEDW